MKGSKLTYEDPFNAAPADNTPAPEPTPAPVAQAPTSVVNAPVAVSNNGDLPVTFKGDGTFASPWIVPKYASVGDALIDLGEDPAFVATQSQAQLWFALFKRVTLMGQEYGKLGGGTPPAPQQGGGQQQSRAPQGAASPPAWFPPAPFPDFVYKTGTTKAGRNAGQPWHAWMPPVKPDPQGREAAFHNPPK